jgi:hypothetical protein
VTSNVLGGLSFEFSATTNQEIAKIDKFLKKL